ncbi:MAG: methyl-accepting chemotaxis protein [Marinagarivorans sp.]
MDLNKRVQQWSAKVSISRKIKLIFIPPLTVSALFIGAAFVSNIDTILQAKKIEATVRLDLKLADLAEGFALERGRTAGYLADGSEPNRAELVKQRKMADENTAELVAIMGQSSVVLDPLTQKLLSELQAKCNALAVLRSAVDARDPNVKAFKAYSDINKIALDAIAQMTLGVTDAQVIQYLNELSSLLWLKERAGQERGTLHGVIASKRFTTQQLIDANFYAYEQSILREASSRLLTSAELEQFDRALDDAAGNEVRAMREKFMAAALAGGAIDLDSKQWFKLSTQRIDNIDVFVKQAAQDIHALVNHMLLKSWLGLLITLAFVGLVVGILIFTRIISTQITSSVACVIKELKRTARDKKFDRRVLIETSDELGDAGQAFNDLMGQLQQAIANVITVTSKVADGDFTARITQDFEGDLEILKSGVNRSAHTVDTTMAALGDVMLALEKGNFSARMSDQVKGEFRQQVDSAMQATQQAIQEVGRIMALMSQGDFSQRISLPLHGALHDLKENVNSSLTNVDFALKDISKAVLAQSEGRFDSRIQGDHQGQLKVLKDTMNASTASMDAALKEIAIIFSHFRAGNFNHKIEAPMKGDLDAMKVNINASLDELNTAIKEIVAVASGQKEGRLDVKIQGQFSGQLKTLQEALNDTGGTLNQVFTGIASAMEGLKKGDFSLRALGEYGGSFKAINDIINDALSALQSSIRDLMTAARAQKEGDLSLRLSGSYQGELKNISTAVNDSMQNLSEIVRNIQASSQHTITMTQDQTNVAVDMASRSQSQASAIESIATAITEISTTVANTEANCKVMSKQIAQVNELTQGSLGTVSFMVRTMDVMRKSSYEISRITNMIDEIAFQTNLLALNAAVEAARAGDQGRGFAVVAGEVRNLAQRSAGAAKEIKSLIGENLDKVEESFQLGQRTRDDLDLIAQHVTSSNSITAQVNTSAQEQANAIREINSAIISLESLTQNIISKVAESSNNAASVENQVQNVNELLGFFRLRA